jgi:hypothetical protein
LLLKWIKNVKELNSHLREALNVDARNDSPASDDDRGDNSDPKSAEIANASEAEMGYSETDVSGECNTDDEKKHD